MRCAFVFRSSFTSGKHGQKWRSSSLAVSTSCRSTLFTWFWISNLRQSHLCKSELLQHCHMSLGLTHFCNIGQGTHLWQ